LEKKLNNPISIFLPEDLLTHFKLVVIKELGEVSSKKIILPHPFGREESITLMLS
jgi:hypothetical protein